LPRLRDADVLGSIDVRSRRFVARVAQDFRVERASAREAARRREV
jgi:uncharacterized protein (DUF2267 family)